MVCDVLFAGDGVKAFVLRDFLIVILVEHGNERVVRLAPLPFFLAAFGDAPVGPDGICLHPLCQPLHCVRDFVVLPYIPVDAVFRLRQDFHGFFLGDKADDGKSFGLAVTVQPHIAPCGVQHKVGVLFYLTAVPDKRRVVVAVVHGEPLFQHQVRRQSCRVIGGYVQDKGGVWLFLSSCRVLNHFVPHKVSDVRGECPADIYVVFLRLSDGIENLLLVYLAVEAPCRRAVAVVVDDEESLALRNNAVSGIKQRGIAIVCMREVQSVSVILVKFHCVAEDVFSVLILQHRVEMPCLAVFVVSWVTVHGMRKGVVTLSLRCRLAVGVQGPHLCRQLLHGGGICL